jgi:hypothetical protein
MQLGPLGLNRTIPSLECAMNESVERKATPSMPALTTGDKAFVGIMVVVLIAVTGLGLMALEEGHKTEGGKRNAEALAAWMTAAGADRFNADYAIAACAGANKTAPTPPVLQAPEQADPRNSESNSADSAALHTSAPAEAQTWGGCLAYLQEKSPLKDLRNPFTGQTPNYEAACSGSDYHLAGALVLEKLVPTPPGSSVPYIASQLAATDRIGEKLQLRLSVCDKGGYGIKVGEFEF